jgi:hypothetical protein
MHYFYCAYSSTSSTISQYIYSYVINYAGELFPEKNIMLDLHSTRTHFLLFIYYTQCTFPRCHALRIGSNITKNCRVYIFAAFSRFSDTFSNQIIQLFKCLQQNLLRVHKPPSSSQQSLHPRLLQSTHGRLVVQNW